MRLATEDGAFFFKAGAPVQAFEPALLGFLAAWRPADTQPLLAADPGRGWALMPDGGPTLRQASGEQPASAVWRRFLRQYAELQLASVEQVDFLLELGVPDRRLPLLPAAYQEILNDAELPLVAMEDGLSQEEHDQLLGLGRQVDELSRALAAFGIPPALEHGDLHDANIFAGSSRPVFFDWGDASITHPFFSLLIPLRMFAYKLGLPDDAPQLVPLRDEYLSAWASFASLPELRQAWALAEHLGIFVRAINWYRVVKSIEAAQVAEYRSSVSGWLQEFLNHGRQ